MKKLKETHDRLLHWHEGVIGACSTLPCAGL